MYLFAPLVLIPFTFGPLFGVISALLILAVSTAVNVYTVLYHYFPPTDFAYATLDPRMTTSYAFYTMLIYNAPWIRCQIYIVGILTGFLLQMKKTMKIPWYVSIAGWTLTIIIAGGCMFSLKDWISGNVAEIGWSTTYSAISKIGWGLALSWITTACYYGYGGPINAFMSWSFWVPLGKLTYSTYLIHICVVVFFTGNRQQDLIFTNFLQMLFMFVVPCVVTAYFFAIFWSSLFEISFGKLEDVLISALFGAPRRPPAPDAAANAIPPTPKPGDPDMSMGQIPYDQTKPSEAANGNGIESLRKRNGLNNSEIPLFGTNQKVATIRLTKLEEQAWQ
jgi:peptidoglycan/LPS O-acetylase OafA/YrhL